MVEVGEERRSGKGTNNQREGRERAQTLTDSLPDNGQSSFNTAEIVSGVMFYVTFSPFLSFHTKSTHM
jgi:hypothetical protein